MLELMTALYNRWVAAGLDSSVCDLYPAGESRRGDEGTGTPVASDLSTGPRAEYEINRGPAQIKTRGSRTYQAVAVIRVWATSTSVVDGSTNINTLMQTVWNALVNANRASTSPMSMANGDILEVDDGGLATGKADKDVWIGIQTLLIRHRVSNRIPA